MRTLRALLALLATGLLVSGLSFLIIESRSVTPDYYVAHTQRMRAIEASADDIAAVLTGLQRASAEGRDVSASDSVAFARLARQNEIVQGLPANAAPDPTLQSLLASYDSTIRRFVADAQAFTTSQNTLADALQTLQAESPLLVRNFREQGLNSQSQLAFTLALDIIEFATGSVDSGSVTLTRQLEELRDNVTPGSQAPDHMVAFAAAARSIIKSRYAAEMILARITASTADSDLGVLSAAVLAANQRTVDRADRARILLSLCAILLLVAGAFVVVRLQSSYRALNESNARLGQSNATLEERVDARTEELSRAYEELKESQTQLVHAEKMSSLGEMVAGISHEINTPLWYLTNNASIMQERLDVLEELCAVADAMVTAVQSRVDVNAAIRSGILEMHRLMKDGIKDDIAEAQDLTQDSLDGLQDLTTLAQGLKDFSRLDRARQGKFNVNDGLDKTLLIARNRIKNKASVHKHYGDVADIRCSPSQINQVFLNLLTNASDAIEESGDIVIHTWQLDGTVEISISDTGSGIPPDVLAKVRDPFFTTKEVGKGTGLGLSIVDQIITAHNGTLRIESEPGRGTTVTISLPVYVAKAAPIGAPLTDAAPGSEPEVNAAWIRPAAETQANISEVAIN